MVFFNSYTRFFPWRIVGFTSLRLPSNSPSPQVAHWRAAHKVVCGKPQEGGGGAGTQLQAQPPRPVTVADKARWDARGCAAADLMNAGRYAEARSSMERQVAEREGAMGKEAEELLPPLRLLADTFMRAGLSTTPTPS